MSQAPYQKIIDGKRIYDIGRDQKTNNSLTKLSFNYLDHGGHFINSSPPGISPKLAHGKIRHLCHPLPELLSFNLIGVADLAYDGKSLQTPMTERTARQYANAPPSEPEERKRSWSWSWLGWGGPAPKLAQMTSSIFYR